MVLLGLVLLRWGLLMSGVSCCGMLLLSAVTLLWDVAVVGGRLLLWGVVVVVVGVPMLWGVAVVGWVLL